MKKFFIALLIFLLPLAALGHDAYYYYQNHEEMNNFRLSETGWLWHHYFPDSHDKALEVVGVPPWKQYITPVLSTKSVVLGLFISGFILLTILIVLSLGMISTGRKARKTKVRGSNLGRARTESQRFEYKRR